MSLTQRDIAAMPGETFPASGTQMLRTAKFQLPSQGDLDVSTEFPRGIGLDVYPQAAPAIVLIRTPFGSGTGFILEKDNRRWVLTNNHVVEDATVDMQAVAGVVEVRFGQLNDGEMRLSPDSIEAVIFKTDERRDLALLQLKKPLPKLACGISLAEKSLKPGEDCVAIGHPTRGALWTLRTGTISATGLFPQDFTDIVLETIRAKAERKDSVIKALQQIPSRNVVLSTCGVNPGDSGGPLLNAKAELVAVTFATPSPAGSGLDLNRFTYHVHLSEVRDFLKEIPQTPVQRVPDPWPAAVKFKFVDQDKNGRPETLVQLDADNQPIAFLFDLDQDSPSPKEKDFDRSHWDWELSVHVAGTPQAFYDTDNDGQFDRVRIVVKAEPMEIGELTLKEKSWSGRRLTSPVIDPSLFKSLELQKLAKQFASFK